MNKFLTCITMLLFSVSAYSVAPTPESVEKLLALTYSESTIDSIHSGVEKMIAEDLSLNGPAFSVEGQRMRAEFQLKFSKQMREEMNWKRLKPIYFKIYSEIYDQEEVDGLTIFYSTSVGQSYQKKMPVFLLRESVEIQSMMQSLLPKIQSVMVKASVPAKTSK
ncbi:MAG: DUF2059 domain-containing protein [Burkholderiaceae bacterium]